MSVKRKLASDPAPAAVKKLKVDFFAPRPSSSSPGATNSNFSFKAKGDNCTRFTTWNVNGIMSVNEKLLKKYMEVEDPSVLILTETKYSKGKPDLMCFKRLFKYQHWGVDPKPGYAGTAILSKFKPLAHKIGIPGWEESSSGRYVELEFDNLFVVGTYVPNSGENFKTMDLKKKWNDALKKHLRSLQETKPVIWAGDFNCIMSKKDIDSTAQGFWNKMSGLSEEERAGMSDIVHPQDSEEPMLVDVWRHLHPADEEYTHFSSKFGAWRLDSFIISKDLLEKSESCEIRHELKDLNLSDHWPVTVDVAINLSG